MLNKRMLGRVLPAVMITFFTFAIGTLQSAIAAPSTCQQIQGSLQTQVVAIDTVQGTVDTQGTITNSDLLNGTTHDHILMHNKIVNSHVVGTYSSTFQDVTADGTLVTRNNGQLFPDHTFTERGSIDRGASTGQFVGVSGSISFSGSTTDGVHYTATVSGQICG